MKTVQTCNQCSFQKQLSHFRSKKINGSNTKNYINKVCKECEKYNLYKWRRNDPEKWNAYQRERYLSKVGKLTRIKNPTPEQERLRQLRKSLKRNTRAKQARVKWDLDLTTFVTEEAHDLRIRRNKLTGFDWHVDHIIPLKGKDVSGFHVWSNLQVIPKVTNLSKGNKFALSN